MQALALEFTLEISESFLGGTAGNEQMNFKSKTGELHRASVSLPLERDQPCV